MRGGGSGGCASCTLYTFRCSIFSLADAPPRNSFFLYYCDTCLRFRGCPVLLLPVELSVSARYQKTRVLLLRARRLLLLLVAAASGSVRHKYKNTFNQSEAKKIE